MKRILLLAATNLAVLALLSIVVRLLGVDSQLAQQGLGADGLLVFAAVIGFGGALLSLTMSRWVAQAMMGVKLIRQPATQQEAWLVEVVHAHARRAGLAPPDVGIFESPTMNAFATGARRDRALVAVSSGLLRGMSAEECAAVLGHEITHVANGDMVTLALLQGLGAWHENFERAWPQLRDRYSARFRRLWNYYLAASAASFRARRNHLWQLVLAPRGRAAVYRGTR